MLLRIVNQIIAIGFYLLFFAVPLVFNPSRNFPSSELFEWNKMLLVYLLTVIIVTAWVAKMIIYKRIIFKRTPFDLPLWLFLFSQVLSTLFSWDPHVSIFGYYSRFHGGLLSTIVYVLLYHALAANWSAVNFSQLLLFSLTSGAVVAIYGILEKFGIDAHMWVQDVRSRVFSTLGQPNWLAAYLTIILPLSISQFIRVSQHFKLSSAHLAKNLELKTKNQNLKLNHLLIFTFYFILLSLFYICLLFTKSRSGFLGFWLSNAIFWSGVLFIYRKNWKKYIGLVLIINSLFLILNFSLTTPIPLYNRLATYELLLTTPPPPLTPPIGDSIINVGITDSSAIRKIVWTGAVKIFQNYPIFGTGPETFAYAYYQYRPAAHNLTSEWDFLYNRAHNEFLNLAANSGIFGLGTYLLFIGTVLVWSVKEWIFTRNLQNRSVIILAFLAGFVSILITNFFGFSVVIVGLFFFLIPCFWFNLKQKTSVVAASGEFQLSLYQKILLTLLLGIGIWLTISILRFWVADMYYARSKSYALADDYTMAYDAIKQALFIRPKEPVYLDQSAQILTDLTLVAMQNQDGTQAAEFIQNAIHDSTLSLKISPKNVNFWKTRTKVLFELAQTNPSFMSQALESILIAGQLAPTDPKIAYNAAIIYGHAGQNQKAIEMLKQTINLKPDYREAYMALAIFYEEEEDLAAAREILETILDKINPDDNEAKDRLEALNQPR